MGKSGDNITGDLEVSAMQGIWEMWISSPVTYSRRGATITVGPVSVSVEEAMGSQVLGGRGERYAAYTVGIGAPGAEGSQPRVGESIDADSIYEAMPMALEYAKKALEYGIRELDRAAEETRERFASKLGAGDSTEPL
jgi:hypothetical protein